MRIFSKYYLFYLSSLSIAILSCSLCGNAFAQKPTTLKLWYDSPAQVWEEALPLGNGKLGAMVFGGIDEELIQLNESSLWSGGPVKGSVNTYAFANLPLIRKALLEDKDYSKANLLTKNMQGLYSQSYLPLGDLKIKQLVKGVNKTDYKRELDLNDAINRTSFSFDGVKYTRDIFISAPDQVMVIKFTSSTKGGLNLKISSNTVLHHQILTDKNELIVCGKAPANVNPSYYNPKGVDPVIYKDTSGCNGMRFQYRIHPIAGDGLITTTATEGITISNGTEVVIYVSAATSFNGYDKCPDSEGKNEKEITAKTIKKAVALSYQKLLVNHIKDYQRYFKRVSLQVKDTVSLNVNSSLPSDLRLKKYSNGSSDPEMEALYFQFGRYLLISSSRPGGPPANLQGIWNKELRAPWSSNYTININTQMNYWPAELTNLSEMHVPLLNFMKGLERTGKQTAKEFYRANGWVAHHNSDIWAISNAVGDRGQGDPVWANWPMGGNWLSRHLYEHYLYTGDKQFLAKQAYPIMKSAAEFCLDWLIEDKNGYLITAPSTTPENLFKDTRGLEQGVSVATTMDMSIIRDLFDNVIDAANILNKDASFKELLISKRNKLYPMAVGKKGQILEWSEDFEETDIHHRHVSHLFGLFPGKEITPETPKLFAAAKKTLEIRGDGGTGWSKAWKINWWARLRDGDHAHKLIRELLTYVPARKESNISMGGGGTYPNFFDAHPPFQIDGNFAGTAVSTLSPVLFFVTRSHSILDKVNSNRNSV